jgi:hypothetical protein
MYSCKQSDATTSSAASLRPVAAHVSHTTAFRSVRFAGHHAAGDVFSRRIGKDLVGRESEQRRCCLIYTNKHARPVNNVIGLWYFNKAPIAKQ